MVFVGFVAVGAGAFGGRPRGWEDVRGWWDGKGEERGMYVP